MVKDYPRKEGFWWWRARLIWDLGKFLDLDTVDNDIWGLLNASFHDLVAPSWCWYQGSQRLVLRDPIITDYWDDTKRFWDPKWKILCCRTIGGSNSRSGQTLVYPGVPGGQLTGNHQLAPPSAIMAHPEIWTIWSAHPRDTLLCNPRHCSQLSKWKLAAMVTKSVLALY